MNDHLQITAPVFNIQTYCIHDGPGIRTTVFVKGCPLKCLWCANPESNAPYPQLLTYQEKCTGCGVCASVCPENAVHMEIQSTNTGNSGTSTKRIALTDRDLCRACGICTEKCAAQAREIAGRKTTVQECLNKILEDKIFLSSSGGGMTISGGEALCHPDFCEALFRACQENGISTAIESCSYGTREAVDQIYRYVDLALLDIKHMDPQQHKRLTGVSNELILENIRHICCDLKVPVNIRVPVIPGYNSDIGNLTATARFVKEQLGADVPIHLLPYHRLGLSKSESLDQKGADYFTVPDDAFMENCKAVIESFGLPSKIGG